MGVLSERHVDQTRVTILCVRRGNIDINSINSRASKINVFCLVVGYKIRPECVLFRSISELFKFYLFDQLELNAMKLCAIIKKWPTLYLSTAFIVLN